MRTVFFSQEEQHTFDFLPVRKPLLQWNDDGRTDRQTCCMHAYMHLFDGIASQRLLFKSNSYEGEQQFVQCLVYDVLPIRYEWVESMRDRNGKLDNFRTFQC